MCGCGWRVLGVEARIVRWLVVFFSLFGFAWLGLLCVVCGAVVVRKVLGCVCFL